MNMFFILRNSSFILNLQQGWEVVRHCAEYRQRFTALSPDSASDTILIDAFTNNGEFS